MSFYTAVKAKLFNRHDAETIDRDGYAAARWLEDPTLNSALAELREGAIDAWRVSRDPETRERAWLMLQQTDLFVQELTAAMQRQQTQKELQARQERKLRKE